VINLNVKKVKHQIFRDGRSNHFLMSIGIFLFNPILVITLLDTRLA
jgi:hypothetical protein